MIAPDDLLDAQTAALLRRLSREQEMRTRRLQDEAAVQARDILARTRTEARARVHQAVLDARRDNEQALARRRAAIETRARRARQAHLRVMLDAAWRELPGALAARWEDPSSRQEWCAAACNRALGCLLHTDRLVVEIDTLRLDELAPLVQAHLARHSHVATVQPIDGLGAGLRLRAGNACLDATLTGLLAARERVAADLLAEFERRLAHVARPGETQP